MNELLAAFGDLFQTFPFAWIVLIFIVGLMVGSFLNVVIHRVPIMLERDWKSQAEQILSGQTDPALAAAPPAERYNLVVPRSACPKCGAMIKAWQNIPVVSYVFLRGKCANCATSISIRYPIVELITAILSALVAWKFGFHWYTAAALFFTWMLIAMSGRRVTKRTVVPAKISAPRLAQSYRRVRLFRALDAACRRRGVWISAPAGAGKTSLVVTYLAARRTQLPGWFVAG